MPRHEPGECMSRPLAVGPALVGFAGLLAKLRAGGRVRDVHQFSGHGNSQNKRHANGIPSDRTYRCSSGTHGCGTDGPVYSARGRIRRLLAYCSRTCAVQPDDAADGEDGREEHRDARARSTSTPSRSRRWGSASSRPSPPPRCARTSPPSGSDPARLPRSLRQLPQVHRARVHRLVDAVAKAGDLLLLRQLLADRALDFSPIAVAPKSSSIFITSSLAPPCSGPLSAPMPPTMAEWMSVSVAAATRREGRGVELVVGVQDQRAVQGAHRQSVGPSPVSMVKEVGGKTHHGIRIDRPLVLFDSPDGRHQAPNLRGEAHGLAVVGRRRVVAASRS